MTAGELIKHLQAWPRDTEVTLLTFNVAGMPDGWWHHHDAESVETYGSKIAIVAQD